MLSLSDPSLFIGVTNATVKPENNSPRRAMTLFFVLIPDN
jgi:hypothetical protein